jgi:hypothetical protein
MSRLRSKAFSYDMLKNNVHFSRTIEPLYCLILLHTIDRITCCSLTTNFDPSRPIPARPFSVMR